MNRRSDPEASGERRRAASFEPPTRAGHGIGTTSEPATPDTIRRCRRSRSSLASIGRLSDFGQPTNTNLDSPSTSSNDLDELNAEPQTHRVICSNGRSLVEAIREGDLSEAKDAFVNAKNQNQLVNLRDDEGRDILRITIEQKRYKSVRLVLENVVDRCTTVKETAQILTENMLNLEKTFPGLLKEFIVKDKFCVEIGKLTVPLKVFKKNSSLVVVTSDTLPGEWNLENSEVEQLWTDVSTEMNGTFRSDSTAECEAVMKFVLIGDIAKPEMNRVIQSLLVDRVSVEAFKSKMIKWTVHWKWDRNWIDRLLFHLIPSMISAVVITIFIILIKSRGLKSNCQDDSDDCSQDSSMLSSNSVQREKWALWFLFSACVLSFGQQALLLFTCIWHHNSRGLVYFLSSPWNWLRAICRVLMIIWIATVLMGDYTEAKVFNNIVVATQGFLLWIAVLYHLLPFRWTGALVATVGTVVLNIIPFLVIAFIVLMAFSTASLSLQENEYRSLDWIMQALLYALMGDFNHIVGESMNHPKSAETSSWDFILNHGFLNVFVLFEGIIVLTVLYQIVTNAYDKVKLNAEPHLTRFRAMATNNCEFTLVKCLTERLKRKTKRYVYVLKPVDKKSMLYGGMKWKGKLKKTEKQMKILLQETKDETNSRLDTMESLLQELLQRPCANA